MKLLFVVAAIAAVTWSQSAPQSVSGGGSQQQNGMWPALSTGPAASLTAITITPSNPTQVVGSSVLLTAMGSYSDNSNQNVTQTSIWGTASPAVAMFGSLGTQQAVSCVEAGTSVITASDGSISASTTLTCVATAAPGGCGASANGTAAPAQSTCGNYSGAPYEDLATASPNTAPSPTGSGQQHLISSCTTIVPTATGDVWRFSANIDDGVGGTNQNCIHFTGTVANNFVIDLAGFTLTGGIKCDQSAGGQNCSGITVVNGTINCNIANGSETACINFNESSNPTKSILFSHLTINNANSPAAPDTAVPGGCAGTSFYCGFEYAMIVESDGTTTGTVPAGTLQKTFNGAMVEEAHLTVTYAAGYTGTPYPVNGWCARCSGIYNGGTGNVTTESWNNIINNGAYVDAQQGIVNFNTGPASVHNNYFPWVQYSGVQDTGRPMLFDAAGKTFNQAGGSAYFNLVEAYNNRCVRTRQVNNVLVHDNRFEHVKSTIVDPCIMMGGNGDYSEDLNGNVVSNNTFTMAGGNAIQAAESYGITASGNSFTCDSNCSTGTLASAWIAEGSNGLTFAIASATRDATCNVTLVLSAAPTTTSVLTGLYVNIGGTNSSFDMSATAGNAITTYGSGTKTITYTQAGCSGAASIGAGGTFWISQSATDAFAGNGAGIYIKNSTIDPLLTMTQPLVACGTASPACQNPPQTTLNGGQTQIKACNNLQGSSLIAAVGGTGTLVQNVNPCP